MPRRRVFAVNALFAPVLALAATAPQTPPVVFVDEGACPFECCTYGTWTTRAPVRAYAADNADAAVIATIPEGTVVQAVTGHVRTRGEPFVVTRAEGDYRPGERIVVYNYLGEGVFRTWRDGRWEEADLGFSVYGGTGGTRCEASHCFGHLERELVSKWWVQVRLPDGRHAWVDGHAGFEGQDACGG